MSGFVAISRKIFHNPILRDADYFRAWVWLICEACWKPSRARIDTGKSFVMVDLERGQLSHSRKFIATALGLTEQRVRTILGHFENEQMIDRKINRGSFVITVCKYDDYQIAPDSINQGSIAGSTSDQPANQPEPKKENKGNNIIIARERKSLAAIPDGFVLDEAMRTFAADRGFIGVNVERMFDRFKNHHTAKGSKFVDWRAAWRTWVGNQLEFQSRAAPPRRTGTPDV